MIDPRSTRNEYSTAFTILQTCTEIPENPSGDRSRNVIDPFSVFSGILRGSQKEARFH